MNPRVSVVMAVHDGGRFVGEAVAGVLAQTFRDFELIVVDDASTDDTPDVLDQFRDPRIVRMRNARSLGPASSRNSAIDASRGELVAILDADDAAAPIRLATQLEFLDAHPDFGGCAGRCVVTDVSGRALQGAPPCPTDDALVAWRLLLFTNPFVHSTLTVRRAVFDRVGRYDERLVVSHDRDFVSRCFRATRLRVLPQELARFRMHDDSFGARNRKLQRENSLQVRRDLLRWFLGAGPPVDALDAWYEPSIPGERVAPLADLLLCTYTEILARFDPPPWSVELVRADLLDRLESIRRRDALGAGRRGIRSTVRRAVSRVLHPKGSAAESASKT
jgi:glycosyltransferase involved in cell wall biosynthesis